MTVARAAIAAGNFKSAREAMQPLIEGSTRPTIRMCHIMADLEEAEHGSAGYVREWLARGARAPHDFAWVLSLAATPVPLGRDVAARRACGKPTDYVLPAARTP